MRQLLITFAVLACVFCSLALAQNEPLCQNKYCGAAEECRVVETCDQQGIQCSVNAMCLPKDGGGRGGCRIGKPLLEPKRGGGYDLRTCYTRRNCGEGFYCSTELQDTSSRCCRAAISALAPKDGSCPVPDDSQTFFCVDQCRSDADCVWSTKCCQRSTNCTRSICAMPAPCSLKTCAAWEECVETPDRQAACVPAKPPVPLIRLGSAQPSGDPLCQNKVCGAGEECRVVETCNQQQGFCSTSAVCIPASNSGRGGCEVGKPLLKPKVGGGYELRTCHTQMNCGEGFYCSTALQDVAARCCRSTATQPKAGACPLPDRGQSFFCVDECRSDGDCMYNSKCCPNSISCGRNRCKPPEPCSLVTCQPGYQCIVNPDRRGECVPRSPPTYPPQGQTRPPSNANNINNNNSFQSFINSLTAGTTRTCPSPGPPYASGECTYANQCGFWNHSCQRGQFCCATSQCGNICRWSVPLQRPRW